MVSTDGSTISKRIAMVLILTVGSFHRARSFRNEYFQLSKLHCRLLQVLSQALMELSGSGGVGYLHRGDSLAELDRECAC